MRLLADEVARSKLGCVAALCCLLNPLTLVAVLSVVHRLFQRLFWRPRLTLANLQARRRTPPPTTAQQLVAALIAANSGHSVALNVVQIGANSGDFNRSNHRDRDAVRPAMLSLLQQPQTRAVLLEPDLSTYRLLERGLHRCQRDWLRRGCSAHVVARHAALCPRAASSSSASSIELFRIAIDRLPKAARDWNERVNGHWAAGEMSSLTRDFVVRAVAHGPGIGLANASKFVDAVRVPCTTAHELLTLPPIEPSAPLGALVVDTEGLDALIVEDFLNASGATPPALIMFELLWAALMPQASRAALPRVVAKLVDHGYRLHCCPNLCGNLFRRLHMQGELHGQGEPRRAVRRAMRNRAHGCDSGFNVFAWDPQRLPSLSPNVLSMH